MMMVMMMMLMIMMMMMMMIMMMIMVMIVRMIVRLICSSPKSLYVHIFCIYLLHHRLLSSITPISQ